MPISLYFYICSYVQYTVCSFMIIILNCALVLVLPVIVAVVTGVVADGNVTGADRLLQQ